MGHAAARCLRVDGRPVRRAGPGRGRHRASRAASRSRSTASVSDPVDARRAAARRWAAPTASAGSTTSRTASSGSRAARSTRRRRRRSCTRAHRALEGLTLSQGHAAVQPLRGGRAGPAHVRRPVVQRPVTATCAATSRRRSASSPATSGCAWTTGRRSSSGRRVAALAVRQEPRHVRRGRRVRPRVGGRVHRDLRVAAPRGGGAPRRGRQAPRRGLDLDRSAARRACRRPSRIRSRPRSRARVSRVIHRPMEEVTIRDLRNHGGRGRRSRRGG